MALRDHLDEWGEEILDENGTRIERIVLSKSWEGNTCSFRIENCGEETIRVKEVVLFAGDHLLAGETPFHGEGYSMLSQYGGTFETPEDIGGYSDRNHYKLPQKDGFFTVYHLLTIFPDQEMTILMAFSSCKRFTGAFRINQKRIEIVMYLEGFSLSKGQTVDLEEFFLSEGQTREALFEQLCRRIEAHHPMLHAAEVPTGWCSWHYYGPDFEEKDIYENLGAISSKIPELKYVQIDDGYQAAMGDWLIPGSSFSGGVQSVCRKIKSLGYEPAIWAAPFIAEESSLVFQEHPEWFVKDQGGKPLSSDRVTFGGWRCAPWYMLDGSHPGAQNYLRDVFRTMKEEWQCHYFKLDANVWGAMPFGMHDDPKVTSVEAYRLGMQAILQGAGEDSFLLGCNAPLWPSLGTVHGMRVTGDISRSWDVISSVAKEGFWRNWQHRRLWINDPDGIVLSDIDRDIMRADGTMQRISQSVTEQEYAFHAAYIFASGGMVLSGDRISELKDEKIKMIRKLIPPVDSAAVFDDASFTIGRTSLNHKTVISLFNWGEKETDIELNLPLSAHMRNFWTGEEVIGESPNEIGMIRGLKPHSAILLEIYDIPHAVSGSHLQLEDDKR